MATGQVSSRKKSMKDYYDKKDKKLCTKCGEPKGKTLFCDECNDRVLERRRLKWEVCL